MNGLRAFDAVARHLSFSRAASELCVTQGAVSRQIANLESYLGLTLFRRANRQVYLTHKGLKLYAAVGDAFQRIRDGMQDISQDADDRTLRIKVPPTFAVRWFVPRLAQFHGRHPEIEVQITTSHQTVDFDREDVDVAVYWGLGKWKGLAVDFLIGETLLPVCSPELMKEKPIRDPRDLAEHVLLHSMHRTDDWRIWMEATGTEGIDWTRALNFENSALTYQAAIDRVGVVVAQHAFVEEDLAANRLVAPFPLEVPGERSYFLVYRPEREDQHKIRAFRTWILEAAGNDRKHRDPAGQ